MSEKPQAASRYDAVPDLAALIDGLESAARAGEHGMETLMRALADVLTGPYSALRGGLLLDEPGRESESTEQAIRLALAGRDAAGTEFR